MLLSFKHTCFPGDITGVSMHVSADEPPHQHSPHPCSACLCSWARRLRGEDAFNHRRAGPAEGAVATLSQRMPGSLSQEYTQVLPPMSLQKQWVSCTCSFAFPGQQIPLQSPALMLQLWVWGQPAWRNHGDCPSQRQEQDLPLSATSSALLFGGLLLTYEVSD